MTRVSLRTGLAVAFTFAASYGLAQTAGAIRGEVLDKDGKPVDGALVLVERTAGPDTGGSKSFEMKTDKKGRYARMNVPPGTYTVTVEKEGFGSAAMDGIPVSGGRGTVDVPVLKLDPTKRTGAAVSDTVESDFKKAAALVGEKKYVEAQKIYLGILEKFPKQSQVLRNLGVVSERLKDLVAAEDYYRRAIEARPESADPYLDLGGMLLGNGQPDKAIEALTSAAAVIPEHVDIQFQLGWTLFNVGRSPEAEGYFEKALTLGSTNPEIEYYLGTIALGKNDSAQALVRLEKYVAAKPTNEQNLTTAQALVAYLKTKK